ncbi:MAG TPA: phosphatase PAP2 family protein [Ramlibacter sp.]|uniref:phosphatase PAP2 family protein n=1 Tax=Ramlibacter sp. TaxID=1917967 RepID=UPI002ED0663B
MAASDAPARLSAAPARALFPLAACLAVLLFLAAQVLLAGPLTRVDGHITAWLSQHRQPWLTPVMLFVSDAHQTAKLLAATALLAMVLAWRRQWRDLRLLAVVPAGMLLNVALKHLFARPRPVLAEPLVQITTFSFPSGHAVASTVFYGMLCALVFVHARSRWWRGAAVCAAIAMVLLVTSSRVYLGAHYLSDVVAGAAEGLALLLLFLRWARR